MKIIADVGGTRGRWVLVDKKIIKKKVIVDQNITINGISKVYKKLL